MRKVLAKKHDFRCDGMIGPDESDDSHPTILNRIVSLDKGAGTVRYEADPRHAEMIVRQLQLENAKSDTCREEEASRCHFSVGSTTDGHREDYVA